MGPNLTSGEQYFVKPNNSNQCTILLRMNPGGTQDGLSSIYKNE